jgi:predicted metal-dependent HD superfamily phosphohydrolase
LTEDLRQDLLARWSESHREHPTVAHLHEMLDVIGPLAESGIEFDREALELAAWFHDAIYEIGRDDNEDRSAELLRRRPVGAGQRRAPLPDVRGSGQGGVHRRARRGVQTRSRAGA